VLLVKKKDGSARLCVDFRPLNKLTTKDSYPLPRISDILDRVGNAQFYTLLDLHSAYHQIPVAVEDREKTAMVTPDGLYQFNVLPFGLCNAPATFQRLIDVVLGDLKWSIAIAYLDDVILLGDTFEQHQERLRLVLEAIRRAQLTLKPSKCSFAMSSVLILGHLVTRDGVKPDPEKIRAVRDFPKPRKVKDVRSFLGLCSYYRNFVCDFARIAGPINQLLRKDTPFLWGEEQETAFERLKEALITAPVLQSFDESRPVIIHTDASLYGIGAILLQKGPDDKEHVVSYISRSLTDAEKRWATTEHEALAIICAIEKPSH
jgi:hypothetical protein